MNVDGMETQSTPDSTSPATTPTGDIPSPQDRDAWRSRIDSIPDAILLAVIQSDKRAAASIFAGFQAKREHLGRTVVRERIPQHIARHPAFGKALIEAAAKAPAAKPAREKVPPKTFPIGTPAPAISDEGKAAPDAATRERERSKELRKRVAALETRLRDSEARLAKTQTEVAELIAERERILRAHDAQRDRLAREERRARRASPPSPAPATASQESARPARPTLATPQPIPSTEADRNWCAAIEATLRNRKGEAAILVLREFLKEDISLSRRATALSLLARASRETGDFDGWVETSLESAGVRAELGEIPGALETLLESIGPEPDSERDAKRSNILAKLLKLAHRDDRVEEVAAILKRFRTRRPALVDRVGRWKVFEDAKRRALWKSTEPAASTVRLGRDEAAGLASSDPRLASATPRDLAHAVETGDAALVTAARKAIERLAQTQPEIEGAILAAVRAIDPALVEPLMSPPLRAAVVDASNVARHDPLGNPASGRFAHLAAMRRHLLAMRCFPVKFIADASLGRNIDDRESYRQWVESGILAVVPPRSSADQDLIHEAKALDAILVTNDRFRDHGVAGEGVERWTFTLERDLRVHLIPD